MISYYYYWTTTFCPCTRCLPSSPPCGQARWLGAGSVGALQHSVRLGEPRGQEPRGRHRLARGLQPRRRRCVVTPPTRAPRGVTSWATSRTRQAPSREWGPMASWSWSWRSKTSTACSWARWTSSSRTTPASASGRASGPCATSRECSTTGWATSLTATP